MKSLIDWNEVVPKLPKKVRDGLYLEAVTFLSEADGPDTRVKKKKEDLRSWRAQGDGHFLSAPGRVYKLLNGSLKNNTAIGRIYEMIVRLNKELVTFEDIARIAKGTAKPSHVITYLWTHKLIDLVS